MFPLIHTQTLMTLKLTKGIHSKNGEQHFDPQETPKDSNKCHSDELV